MENWIGAFDRERLIEAGRRGLTDEELVPLVRLFQPDGAGVWLIAELDAADPSLAYGLADFGMGTPETGTFSLAEIGELRGALNLAVERDLAYVPRASLADMARWATAAGRILR